MSANPPTGYWPAPGEVIAADRPTIPGYEIFDELGRGGMGVVYKARQVSLKRLVALKLLRDSALASPEERARFRIEAEAAARMKHPNVVAIYEIGEHAGRPYFAMELVEGGSLDKHLAGQPLPAAQAAELLRIVALAVQHAHEQKVVHRDLKPANILLQKNESRAEGSAPISSFVPKITDFGLAKRLDSDSTALTREGSVLGTANYMAPEQAEGRAGAIGLAADVYALGAILYELLTGRPPFQADSWNQLVQQVLHEEPKPPARLQPDVPRDLETVCLKCLEKKAERRYASAGELADDLGRFLKGRPVAALPLSDRERLDRLAERNGYQIVAAIGHGPRSTVYHALEGPLKQAVALKVYREGVCTREEWEAWLRRAADMYAGLAHPHIVPIRQAGWWDSAPCLTLEHVPHGSLAAKLSGQPHTIPQALRLVEQLTEVVSYLHRQGVVHGNLKPANVLLAANSIPRVADFHLSGVPFQRPQLADNVEPAALGYLAPELVRDADAELRPYTDIYGLGMILYELLTGRPPFGGASAQEVLEQVRSQDPIPPSRLNAKVTPQLEACCLRCLRKNPWRRYHRAYDLLMRLRYFQDHSEGGT
ncbi:MAG TPA: serine/threonine-protein kinase [Gemmataceae bacterium]|nr:serine/threonine-protein kinase [Gemmataceae bacterium]